jgi:hypothetical protein
VWSSGGVANKTLRFDFAKRSFSKVSRLGVIGAAQSAADSDRGTNAGTRPLEDLCAHAAKVPLHLVHADYELVCSETCLECLPSTGWNTPGTMFPALDTGGRQHAVAKSTLAASRRRSHGPSQATGWRHTPRRPEATDIPRAIPRTTDDICGHVGRGGTLAMKMRDASEMAVLSDSCTEPDSLVLSDRPHVHCEA